MNAPVAAGGQSLFHQVYDLLEREDDSLTDRQINARLTEEGVVTGGIGNIAARLRQGEIMGQFVHAEIDGQLHWTNNPEWGNPKKAKKKTTAMTVQAPGPAPEPEPAPESETERAPEPAEAVTMNTAGTEGYADLIRMALRGSDHPLSIDEIIVGIAGEVSRRGLRTILAQRVRAGELIRHPSQSGAQRYSLNPEHALRLGRGGGSKPKQMVPRSTKPMAPIKPRAEPMPPAEDGQTKPEGAPAVQAAGDGFFGEQLDAVAADIEALVVQACDRQMPHRLIKQLVTAQVALLRVLSTRRAG